MGNVLMRGIKLWQWCKNVHRWAYVKESATKIRPKELISLRTTHGISDLVHMCLYTNTSKNVPATAVVLAAPHLVMSNSVIFDQRAFKYPTKFSAVISTNCAWVAFLDFLKNIRASSGSGAAWIWIFAFRIKKPSETLNVKFLLSPPHGCSSTVPFLIWRVAFRLSSLGRSPATLLLVMRVEFFVSHVSVMRFWRFYITKSFVRELDANGDFISRFCSGKSPSCMN